MKIRQLDINIPLTRGRTYHFYVRFGFSWQEFWPGFKVRTIEWLKDWYRFKMGFEDWFPIVTGLYIGLFINDIFCYGYLATVLQDPGYAEAAGEAFFVIMWILLFSHLLSIAIDLKESKKRIVMHAMKMMEEQDNKIALLETELHHLRGQGGTSIPR